MSKELKKKTKKKKKKKRKNGTEIWVGKAAFK